MLLVSPVVLLVAKLCHHNPVWFLNCLSNFAAWLAGLCPEESALVFIASHLCVSMSIL